MATDPNTVCYSCSADLSKSSKNRVIIRNRKEEYSTLYTIVTDVLRSEQIQMRPENVHSKLDGVICKSCHRLLSKFSSAIQAVDPIKTRMKELFVCERSDVKHQRLEDRIKLEAETQHRGEGSSSGSGPTNEGPHAQQRGLTESEEYKADSFMPPNKKHRYSSPAQDEDGGIAETQGGEGSNSGNCPKVGEQNVPKLTIQAERDGSELNHRKSEVTGTGSKTNLTKHKKSLSEVDKTFNELSKKPFGQYTLEQLRTWTQTVRQGKYDSTDQPPKNTVRCSRKHQQTNAESTQVPQAKKADCSTSTSGSTLSPNRKVSVRGQLFDQLAKWHKLNKDGIVSDNDYEELKKTILSDIKQL